MTNQNISMCSTSSKSNTQLELDQLFATIKDFKGRADIPAPIQKKKIQESLRQQQLSFVGNSHICIFMYVYRISSDFRP